MPKMILIMTGNNIHEAVKPTEDAEGRYYFYTPRYPRNLAFESAIQIDATAHNISLPSKIYLAKMNSDLIIDHFSAKMFVPECFAAVPDIVASTILTSEEQAELDHIKVSCDESWNQYADENGLIYGRDIFGPLRKKSNNYYEQFWFTAYKDRIAAANLWEDWM